MKKRIVFELIVLVLLLPVWVFADSYNAGLKNSGGNLQAQGDLVFNNGSTIIRASDGFIGIGTLNPTYQLHIKDSTSIDLLLESLTDYVEIGFDTGASGMYFYQSTGEDAIRVWSNAVGDDVFVMGTSGPVAVNIGIGIEGSNTISTTNVSGNTVSGNGIVIGANSQDNYASGWAHSIPGGDQSAVLGGDHVTARGINNVALASTYANISTNVDHTVIFIEGNSGNKPSVTTDNAFIVYGIAGLEKVTGLQVLKPNDTLDVKGTVEIDGSVSFSGMTSITGDYTVANEDFFIECSATLANISTFLPSFSAQTRGRMIEFKKVDSSANDCIIDANGADTIDGAASKSITTQYNVIRLIAGKTQWLIH